MLRLARGEGLPLPAMSTLNTAIYDGLRIRHSPLADFRPPTPTPQACLPQLSDSYCVCAIAVAAAHIYIVLFIYCCFPYLASAL